MTIHELYNKHKEAYQKYAVEAEIHDKHIATLVSELQTKVVAVENAVKALPESPFKEKVVNTIISLKESDDIGRDLRDVTHFREILETLASELESKIRVMLDGPV